MNTTNHTVAKKYDDGQEYLKDLCIGFQKRRLVGVGPGVTIISSICWILTDYSWQMGLIAIECLVATALFYIALKKARAGDLSSSQWTSLYPVLLVSFTTVGVVEGMETVMILVSVAMVVQVAIFSPRVTTIGSVLLLLLMIVDKYIDIYGSGMFERLKTTMAAELLASISIGTVMVIQFWVHLRKYAQTTDHFLEKANALNRTQEKSIKNISTAMPKIDDSANAVTAISERVMQQAGEQASAMVEMSATIEELMIGSVETTQAAVNTQEIAQNTSEALQRNEQRLLGANRRFEEVYANISSTERVMKQLLEQMDNVESVLNTNREIGEHIKVLSVNASIEAAEAGEAGVGFAVVANELRSMIGVTETNFLETTRLLNDIRTRSGQSIDVVDNATTVLHTFHDELSETRTTLSNSVQSFTRAAAHIKQIAAAASEQKAALGEVNGAIKTLQQMAKELSRSSEQLVDTNKALNDSRALLSSSLDA